MFRIAYTTPSMSALVGSVARVQQASAGVQATSQAQRTPLVPQRLLNYAQHSRAWGPKSYSFFFPAQPTAAEESARPLLSAGTRKLCPFTGLTLKNGKLDPDQALRSIRRNAGPGLRTVMERPAGDTARASLPRLTVGMLGAAATGTAGKEAQPAKALVPACVPTVSQPASRPAEGAGDLALERIASIRSRWQSGGYAVQANAIPAEQTARAAMDRITAELAHARKAGD